MPSGIGIIIELESDNEVRACEDWRLREALPTKSLKSRGADCCITAIFSHLTFIGFQKYFLSTNQRWQILPATFALRNLQSRIKLVGFGLCNTQGVARMFFYRLLDSPFLHAAPQKSG